MLTAAVVLAVVALGLSAAHSKVNKHKPWIETSYHGVITENTDVVLLDPPLVALDKDAPIPYAGEICAFNIHGLEAPFEAVVLNGTSGEGQLRARGLVDCELQKEYTFIIQAHDCGSGPRGTEGKKSHKAVVHIQVNDVNEFAPVFREPEYQAAVTEGKIYDSILQVEATDQDCSPQYSQICNYQITTTNTPFAIDRNGNIRNTEKLSYDQEQQYEIQVTAWDCGQKRALHSVLVRIDIKPVCKPGWQGWNKQVDYEPGTGSKQLFPKMHLETCGGPLSSARTTVELLTSHIGKGCDRETYSEKSLQKLCGASSGSTDLLPTPSAATNWTASLMTDSGRDSDLIFRFDGHQAAKIPGWVVPQNLTDQFTIATWMKHGPSPGLRAEKETLLCNSDKTEMNRHHYSLYVHNCRLVLLLRRDFTQVDTFRPAEFHWKLDQICDKEWHYYVINVEFPAVTLYVDGVTYDPYLVTDDWPIHPSQIDVQLTVGACWQGGEVTKPRFTQYFRGSLSGLTIRPGKIESQKVISCLQACKEGLDINSLESLDKSIKPSEPRITITGLERQSRPASDLRRPEGVALFQQLHIISTVTRGDVVAPNTDQRPGPLEEIIHNLDYCDILVLGEELRPDQESLQLQRSILLGKHLDATNSTSGMSIFGVDSMANYEDVIREVRYYNWRPAQLTEKRFRLTCSELNGRYTSNEFNLEVSILHSSSVREHISQTVAPPQHMKLVLHPSMIDELYPEHSSGVPSAATVVIVMCIATLVVVVVLGIYHIHLTHQQEVKLSETTKEEDGTWDNSALSITVNPMENLQDPQAAEEEASEEEDEDDDDEEEDDDITSAESDDSEEEVDVQLPRMQGTKRMNWDKTTISY
ncbi:calsyntenin-2-like isoform X2 [Phycodurus eques]|uniref:calsyntenin-2-like isoform X2 n=1 Tax=Phycodurus eques TaxID=693459 RepID=UPI002ACDDAEE|nr:calsyntenin-2-like isoform X2 [Phycodurus eques]